MEKGVEPITTEDEELREDSSLEEMTEDRPFDEGGRTLYMPEESPNERATDSTAAEVRIAEAWEDVSGELHEEELTLKYFYECTARQIEREEKLLNNRISWMLTFEGFLFAAIAFIGDTEMDQEIRLIFKNTVPLIGMIVALLTLIGIWAAYLSINDIKANWKEKLGDRLYPPAFGNPRASRLGRITGYGIPLSIVSAWLIYFILLTNIA